MEFSVIKIEKVKSIGGLIALAQIKFGDVVVKDFRIIRSQEGGHVFFAMPQTSWWDGERMRHKKMIFVDPDFLTRIYDAIEVRWNELEALKFQGEMQANSMEVSRNG